VTPKGLWQRQIATGNRSELTRVKIFTTSGKLLPRKACLDERCPPPY